MIINVPSFLQLIYPDDTLKICVYAVFTNFDLEDLA